VSSRRRLDRSAIAKIQADRKLHPQSEVTMRRRHILVLIITAVAGGLHGMPAKASEPPVYEAYAVRYATLVGYPVASLVQGADRDRKLDIAMMFWVLKGLDGKIVLVDAGFYRPKTLKRTDLAGYVRPDKALERLGIKPEEVTDVVITHMHWDHAEGVDLFPKAQVWIQKAEYADSAGADRKAVSDDDGNLPPHYEALIKLNKEGRVHHVDGDAKEIAPGVTVYIGGKHTSESQYVVANTRAGRMVIASDNVYLYENLDKHVPIAQTFDAKANLAAQDRMKKIATNPRLIIPGHDPEVFVRFPKPGNGVARVE
jgi:glyoxylase-like metal-dependent hydrolase (beta-lactamase superfamily II)